MIKKCYGETFTIFLPLRKESLDKFVNGESCTSTPEKRVYRWMELSQFEEDKTLQFAEEKHHKIFVENLIELQAVQTRHIEYLHELEEYKKKIDEGESVQELVEYIPPLPDFAILYTDPRSVWRYHYSALYIPELYDDGETWKTYHGFDGDFPTEEELNHLKGIIIPGNPDNPLDESLEYLNTSKAFLAKIYETHPHIKIIGCCFGHYHVTQALGGEVSVLNTKCSLITGKFKSYITREFKQSEEFKAGFGEYDKDFIYGIRCQTYEVTKMPEGSIALASSDYGKYDIYRIGDRVLCLQIHADFTERFLEYKIMGRAKARGALTEEDCIEIRQNFYESGIVSQNSELMQLIKSFLKKQNHKPNEESKCE
jgi:GMP synthase-like glutamine amidotransferase